MRVETAERQNNESAAPLTNKKEAESDPSVAIRVLRFPQKTFPTNSIWQKKVKSINADGTLQTLSLSSKNRNDST